MSLLHNAQNFVQGTTLHAVKDALPLHIEEQVALRAFLCSPCLENKSCDICHCSTPQMFYAPKKQDSRNRWAEFLSHSQWEALKNNIDDYAQFIRAIKTTES